MSMKRKMPLVFSVAGLYYHYSRVSPPKRSVVHPPGLCRVRENPSEARAFVARKYEEMMRAARLQVAVYVCAAIFVVVTSMGFAAFTADDAYIVARYAVNARDTGAWAFNPGEHVSAMTSPLHGLILVALSLVGVRSVALLQGDCSARGCGIVRAAPGGLWHRAS